MIESYTTGASGFIGKRLFERLPDQKFAIPHENISTSVLQHFNRFYFLSTYGNMAQHDHHFSRLLQANIMDVGYLVEHILRKFLHCGLFVYVSSSSVGLKVQTPYSRCKRAAEELLLASSLPVLIVRPFSVTGVGEQSEHLIPKLIESCMTGKTINLVPDAVHDFIDVEDVVSGLITFSENQKTGVYEFGRGKGYSNEEVLSIVENVTQKKANVQMVKNLRSYDSRNWFCHNPAFKPTKALETSVREMVQAYV